MNKFGAVTSFLGIVILVVFLTSGSASADSLPEVVFLGDGPGSFNTPLDNFIVKVLPFDFLFVPGPTYQASANQRVWGVRGAGRLVGQRLVQGHRHFTRKCLCAGALLSWSRYGTNGHDYPEPRP